MKFESYLLRAMFVVCMVLCFATLGSMLFPVQPIASPAVAAVGIHEAVPQAGALASVDCPVDAEGTPCARMD